jgi:hypothetical protein
MALALLAAARDPSMNDITIISRKLAELKRTDIEIGDITVSRGASGYYSEQFDRFLSSFLISGDAEKRSPITLLESGFDVCNEIIRTACSKNRPKVESIARAFNFNLSEICP